jgi:hypothetical protein
MENKQVLTPEEVTAFETKATEIAKERGVPKVHPVVFIQPTTFKRIVAYLRQPTFSEKLFAMDQALTAGVYMSANNLAELLLIREHSDPLCVAESTEADDVKMGIVDYCMGLVSRYQNQFAKK